LHKKNGEKFKQQMPYSKALKGLYFKKWTPPHYGEDALKADDINIVSSGGKSQNALVWYIYVIIAVVVVAIIIIVVVSVMKYRQLKNMYKGYQPISTNTDKEATENNNTESTPITIDNRA